MGIPVLKMRRSRDRLIFNMGDLVTGNKTSLYWDGPQGDIPRLEETYPISLYFLYLISAMTSDKTFLLDQVIYCISCHLCDRDLDYLSDLVLSTLRINGIRCCKKGGINVVNDINHRILNSNIYHVEAFESVSRFRNECFLLIEPGDAAMRPLTISSLFKAMTYRRCKNSYVKEWWLILIWSIGTNIDDIGVKLGRILVTKRNLKMLSATWWWPSCLDLNILRI